MDSESHARNLSINSQSSHPMTGLLVLPILATRVFGADCTVWQSACFPSHQDARGCLVALTVHFVDLRAPYADQRGGAIEAFVDLTIDIDRCTFLRCSAAAISATVTNAFGGACYLVAHSTIRLSNTCGCSCHSGEGQFAHAMSWAPSGHTVNASTLLLLGLSSPAHRAVAHGFSFETANFDLASVNFTNCSVQTDGAVCSMLTASGSVSARWLTVVGCAGQSALFVKNSDESGTIERSNFVENTIIPEDSLVCAVVIGEGYGTILTECVFLGNLPDGHDLGLRSSIVRAHTVNNCVFSGDLPSSSYFSGAENKATVSATHVVHENDFSLCYATPCPIPECAVIAGGCFATASVIQSDVFCCVIRVVQFVDLLGLLGSAGGGAIFGENFHGLEISGCLFQRCSLPTGVMMGGAAYFFGLTGEISISDCCITQCFAAYAQSFELHSVMESGHALNSSLFMACGTLDGNDALRSVGFYLDRISAVLRCLNDSYSCGSNSGIGMAFATRLASGSFDGSFLSVSNGTGRSMIRHDSDWMVSILAFSNFYFNIVSLGVLSGAHPMVVRSCIFQETGAELNLDSGVIEKFILQDCVFSGSFPSGAYTLLGDGNVHDSLTMSFTVLFAHHLMCSTVPCVSATSSPSFTPARSQSPPASTTPEFETYVTVCGALRQTQIDAWWLILHDNHFIDIVHRSKAEDMHGGAVCVKRYRLITMTRTAFASCRVEATGTAGTAGDGGGFYFGDTSEAISISESYGSNCSASKGQFGSVVSTGATQCSLNETTVLTCGQSSDAQFGGLELEQTISSLNVNFTDCTVSLRGAAIEAFNPFSVVFMTCISCSAVMAVVFVLTSDNFSVIESSNFVSNSVSYYGVLYVSKGGVTLTDCVFVGNTGSPLAISTLGEVFQMNNCKFSTNFPSSSLFTGTGNTENIDVTPRPLTQVHIGSYILPCATFPATQSPSKLFDPSPNPSLSAPFHISDPWVGPSAVHLPSCVTFLFTARWPISAPLDRSLGLHDSLRHVQSSALSRSRFVNSGVFFIASSISRSLALLKSAELFSVIFNPSELLFSMALIGTSHAESPKLFLSKLLDQSLPLYGSAFFESYIMIASDLTVASDSHLYSLFFNVSLPISKSYGYGLSMAFTSSALSPLSAAINATQPFLSNSAAWPLSSGFCPSITTCYSPEPQSHNLVSSADFIDSVLPQVSQSPDSADFFGSQTYETSLAGPSLPSPSPSLLLLLTCEPRQTMAFLLSVFCARSLEFSFSGPLGSLSLKETFTFPLSLFLPYSILSAFSVFMPLSGPFSATGPFRLKSAPWSPSSGSFPLTALWYSAALLSTPFCLIGQTIFGDSVMLRLSQTCNSATFAFSLHLLISPPMFPLSYDLGQTMVILRSVFSSFSREYSFSDRPLERSEGFNVSHVPLNSEALLFSNFVRLSLDLFNSPSLRTNPMVPSANFIDSAASDQSLVCIHSEAMHSNGIPVDFSILPSVNSQPASLVLPRSDPISPAKSSTLSTASVVLIVSLSLLLLLLVVAGCIAYFVCHIRSDLTEALTEEEEEEISEPEKDTIVLRNQTESAVYTNPLEGETGSGDLFEFLIEES
jgi:hypothetical protein